MHRTNRTMNRRRVLPVLAGLALLAACSPAVSKPAGPMVVSETTTTEKGGLRHQAVTIRATVESVDAKARTVDLVGFDGTREKITVGDQVKNLAQVARGDEVVVTYYQAVAFEVLRRGDKREPVTAAEATASAEPGQMPAGAALNTMTVVADVVRLDPEASTAVLRGPEGNLRTVDIENPAVFQKVKAGDRVEIRLTEAMAIDVERVAER